MNILEKIAFYKKQYEELSTLPDNVDVYLSSYDVDGMSIDAMMKEFFHVFGKYDITNKDFICIAQSLGYEYKQICVDGIRYYTLIGG